MRQFEPVKAVGSLLIAVALLMLGNGFVGTLLSIRLEAAGVSAPFIALLTTAYFAGLTAGSFRMGGLVARVGHIRAFGAVVSLLSASTLTYAIFPNLVLWIVLRFVDGLCIAGVYLCIESWLNRRATVETRGTILAAYMIALYSGQAAGQFFVNLEGSPMLPFVVSSVLVSLAVIPVALTRIASPDIEAQSHIALPALFRASPLGLVGVGATGLALGAFYGLAAVAGRQSGLAIGNITFFISAVIAGGVALQYPMGHLSDRFDRRLVILVATVGGALAAVALAVAGAVVWAMALAGALLGGMVFALYPLCVAHTNDRLTEEEQLSASGGLILVYSAGAAAGPIAGSLAMQMIGPAGLYLFIAGVIGAAMVFAIWRIFRSEAVPNDQQQPYQILPRTSPMSAALEPFSEESEFIEE
ncbi:MFS transporter [uncultured Croceicoccus sp.]|uniref:MFS transporter n=1 Tax=uncultured Croceicoccus sp. TaxID=1295329 RepID=UPI00261FFB10|nr:MFS transporter [uncultured Croceicoccus sp.]